MSLHSRIRRLYALTLFLPAQHFHEKRRLTGTLQSELKLPAEICKLIADYTGTMWDTIKEMDFRLLDANPTPHQIQSCVHCSERAESKKELLSLLKQTGITRYIQARRKTIDREMRVFNQKNFQSNSFFYTMNPRRSLLPEISKSV